MRRLAPIVAAAGVLVAIPATAHAACGGVEAAPSTRDVAKGPDPVAIGDSVMLLAVNRLARVGFDVNAQGCRQWRQGQAILRRKKRHHRLPRLVVMALAIVTPREPNGIYSGDAKRIRAAGRAHPRRIKVIDWVRHSRGHGGWFGPDGIHLTYTGVTNYVRFIRRSLRWANGPSASG
jgi:hypothetical protein